MATETQVRKKIRCCKCREIFSLLIETAGEPVISVRCLYCDASLHINLTKYPKTETEIMRTAGEDAPKTVSVYVLPEILETMDNGLLTMDNAKICMGSLRTAHTKRIFVK